MPDRDHGPRPTELVRVYRSGFHEGSHYGAVVITDTDGSVLHRMGDVQSPIFPRSSSKPFQSVAMLNSGADLTGADLALASASHSGEPMHVDRALAMLDRAGVTEDDLRCPTALPMNDAARLAVLLAADGPAAALHTVVVGTVMVDPVLVALRRMAQEAASAELG